MNEYPILDYRGNKIGTVVIPGKIADFIATKWESANIQADVLRGFTATGAHNDQLISFSLMPDPVTSGDVLPCGPCDCEDCTSEDEAPLGPIPPPGHGVLWGDSDD